jgi:hypothetical protein
MVKTAPHFGHLTFDCLETFEHPKEKTAIIARAMTILTHFLIPYFLLPADTIDIIGPYPCRLHPGLPER